MKRSRPICRSAFTTRRRSSKLMSSITICAMASHSRARNRSRKRPATWLAAFSNRGAGRLSSSNLASAASRSASSNVSLRLNRSPSIVTTSICNHSASKPSCEVPWVAVVMTAPRSLSRCTAAILVRTFGVSFHVARMYAIRSPGANEVPRRWSTLTQSCVVAGSSRRLYLAWARAMTDHACGCAAASPARYRASSSAVAASMSSTSNKVNAVIWLSALISMT